MQSLLFPQWLYWPMPLAHFCHTSIGICSWKSPFKNRKKKINSFSWLPEALWFGSLGWLELFAKALLVAAIRYKILFSSENIYIEFFLCLHNIKFFSACAIIEHVFLHYFHCLHLLFCTYILFKAKQLIMNSNIHKGIVWRGRKAFSLTNKFGGFCGAEGHYVGCKVYIL